MDASTLNALDGLISAMSLADRIREAMGSMTQAELARAIKRTESAVTFWLDGTTKNLKGDSAARLEDVTGYSSMWLINGKGPKRVTQIGDNVSSASARAKVPLISDVQAGNLRDITDMFEPGVAEDWIEAYESTPGSHAFALRVSGDSMTSPYPGERSFPEGTILIVDPDRSAHAGDYVVAKDVHTQRATFKKLVADAGRWYLKPLNPAYPTVEIDDPAMRVIGRVIEYRIGEKL